jgi:dTDP-4-amino-4,6-dideoxygalactose transaminase
VLADVGEELNITAETAETVFSGKTKAIIVPHLFGNPAEIGPIIDLARANNVRVIDDAAQALGAAIDGQPLGSLGDAGIVSFAREKICSGLGGGAVVFKDRELAARLGNVRLSAPARVTELGNLLSILVWHRWRRWSWPLRGLLSAAAQHNPAAPPSFYRSEAMANLKAAVAYSLMQVLQENIRARRGRVEAYRALLGADERLQLIAHGDGSACLTQIVRVLPPRSGEDLAFQAIEALGDAGYEVQGSYVPIHLLPGYERCQRNRLPRAERVWSDLIELPCEPEVELIHVERIAAILKKVLDR